MADQNTSHPGNSDPRWVVRRYWLGEEPGDDLSAVTSAEERVEMVWTLTARLWELTGQPRPSCTRSNLPVRITRLT